MVSTAGAVAPGRMWTTPSGSSVVEVAFLDAESGGTAVGANIPGEMASSSPAHIVEARREAQFLQLAEQWKRETAPLSSISQIARHRAYQRIIGMGTEAIPLILRDLQDDLSEWFWALDAITGASPVPPESEGDLSQMAEAWIRWGQNNGYV